MGTAVFTRSPVGTKMTHNQKFMMMMLFLILRSMFLTQEVMVDASWRYGVIVYLNSSIAQPPLHTDYYPWSLCMRIQTGMRITHTIWRVTARDSRCLVKVSPRMKIIRCWMRRVPDFGSRFCPIFGQKEYEFLATTVKKLFDRNSSNKFCIRLCVQIFSYFFCYLNSY